MLGECARTRLGNSRNIQLRYARDLNGSDSLLRAYSTWSAMDKLLEVVNIARSSFCIVCVGNNCEAITNDAH